VRLKSLRAPLRCTSLDHLWTLSLRVKEDVVVVGGNSPVLAVVVFLWEIFLVVSEESVQLDALLEVLDSLHASNLLQEVEVAVDVDACTDETVPVDALESDIGVVLLELEVDGLEEVDVWALDCVHVLARHLKLVEIKVLGEHLHLCYIYYKLILRIQTSCIICNDRLFYRFIRGKKS
jgi:hypothetical protein